MHQPQETVPANQPAPSVAELVQAQPTAAHRLRRYALWAVVLVLVTAVFQFFGVDVVGWLDDVWKNIEAMPPIYIVAAVILKTAESSLTAVSWMYVLRAVYPQQQVTYKLALGAYQGGVGINAVVPAKAGTWTMLGLFRLYIPGSKLAALLSAFAVQSLAFAAFSIVNYIVLIVAHPDGVDTETGFLQEAWDYISAHTALFVLILVCAGLLIFVAVRAYSAKIKSFRTQLEDGGAILHTPGRYATHAFLPALLSYVCRWGYTGIFMAAFDIPVTFYTIFLVIAANSLAGAVAVTPGGVGTTQAINVAVLKNYAPADVVTAFSLAEGAVLTVWNIIFGLIVMSWAFGWSETKTLVRERKQVSERMEAERADEAESDEAEETAAQPAPSDASPPREPTAE